MKSRKRLVLGVNDVALVVRGSGELDLILPDRAEDEAVSPDQFALISFANSFQNERVRKLLEKIWKSEEAERS